MPPGGQGEESGLSYTEGCVRGRGDGLWEPSAGRAPVSNPGMGEAGSYGGNSSMPVNGLTVAQNQVLNLIKACPRPEGLNFHDLKNQLQHMSVASIKQAVDFLSNEGHIYSTVDDDHFKSTDAE